MIQPIEFKCNNCTTELVEVSNLNVTPMTFTIEKRVNFCTGSIVDIKKSMRAQIEDANLNKSNGDKDDIINFCQPILTRFTELLSDAAEDAYVASLLNI